MIRVSMYLNLEGAATFILTSLKCLRDKSLILSNGWVFHMYQWSFGDFNWRINYVFDWYVKSEKQSFNCLGKPVCEVAFIPGYTVVLSLICPPSSIPCRDHSYCLSPQDGSLNTMLHLINLRREVPTGRKKIRKPVNIVMLSWHVRCWVMDHSCHCKSL